VTKELLQKTISGREEKPKRPDPTKKKCGISGPTFRGPENGPTLGKQYIRGKSGTQNWDQQVVLFSFFNPEILGRISAQKFGSFFGPAKVLHCSASQNWSIFWPPEAGSFFGLAKMTRNLATTSGPTGSAPTVGAPFDGPKIGSFSGPLKLGPESGTTGSHTDKQRSTNGRTKPRRSTRKILRELTGSTGQVQKHHPEGQGRATNKKIPRESNGKTNRGAQETNRLRQEGPGSQAPEGFKPKVFFFTSRFCNVGLLLVSLAVQCDDRGDKEEQRGHGEDSREN
jgi:hypothetical protein